MDKECREVGLKINISKTELMGMTKRKKQLRINMMYIGGQPGKQTGSFSHLGSLVDEDDSCDAEIRSRLGMGKTNV